MFNEYFIQKSGSRSNLFQNSIASFLRNVPESSPNEQSQPRSSILASDGQLSFLAQGMVEILFLRFGHLGCEQQDHSNRNFYVSSLATDSTSSMFDPPRNQRNPISELGNHRIIQLVDVWFFAHPLSALISKTLLVSEIKDGKVDYALLAAILADASEFHRRTGGTAGINESSEDSGDDSEILWNFAATQLKCRPLDLTNPIALSTVQALILVGWRDTSLGNARRATCFIGYTCNIVARMYQQCSSRGSNNTKLNGVAINDVEKELLQNIYWLCLSTTTWAFMQIDQPFSLLVPDEIPDFPNPDETASAVLRLDRASGNISTLQAQIRSTQQLWPLSHVTSTVGHIYTLYLNAATEAQRVEAVPWQKRHLHQLHQLLRSRLNSPVLSLEIRGILLQAIQAVEREVSNISPQSCLLTTYHTIAIHTLFPATTKDQEPLQISPAVIHAFCQSTSAILAIAERFKSTPPTTEYGRVAVGVSTLVLALDSCSRALLRIYEQTERGSVEEYNVVAMMGDQLTDYAGQLHQMSRIDLVSLKGSVIRPVKKRLKKLKQAFQCLGSSSTNLTTVPSGNDLWNENTGLSELSQGKQQNLTQKDIPFESLLPADLIDIECDPILGFQLSKEILDPCSFVTEPEIGCPLGFPAFTKIGGVALGRRSLLDESSGTQQEAIGHLDDDVLQNPVSANYNRLGNQADKDHMGGISLNNNLNGQENTGNSSSGVIPSEAGVFQSNSVGADSLLDPWTQPRSWLGALEVSETEDFPGRDV